MSSRENQPQSPEPETAIERDEGVYDYNPDRDSASDLSPDLDVERPVTTVPTAIEIDLGIDPCAYRYESWSEMADRWVDVLRSSAETMPDPEHGHVRNVTPLVPLADVEALVERMIMAGEVVMAHEDTDGTTRKDTPTP